VTVKAGALWPAGALAKAVPQAAAMTAAMMGSVDVSVA